MNAATIRSRAFAAHFRERKAEPRRTQAQTCRWMSGSRATSSKAAETASSTTSTEALEGRDAARDHQRSADGGDGRGRPALQQQRADRRRGAAERRGDEGRRRPSRAAHGEGRQPQPRARSCSPRSRATCTTSARTWSRSSWPTTAFEVVNLGIKVPPEQLIEAVQRAPPGHHRAFGPPGEDRRSRWWRPPGPHGAPA